MDEKTFLKVPKEKRQLRNKKNYFSKRKNIPDGSYYTEISSTIKENSKFGIKENINFKKIIEYLTKNALEKNEKGWQIKKISYDLYCEALTDPLIIPPRDLVQNNVDVVLESFYHIQQSFSEVDLLNEQISIIITTYAIPSGTRNQLNSTNYFKIKENGRISVANDDNYCLFYAIILSRFYQIIGANESFEISYDQFRRIYKNKKRQKNHVLQLIQETKIDPNRTNYGIDDLLTVQEYYDQEFPGKFLIVAFSKEWSLKPMFKGQGPKKYIICIFLENGHWDGLKSVKQFFDIKHYYCVYCEQTFREKIKHSVNCIIKCQRCGGWGLNFPCKNEENVLKECLKCNRFFFNVFCYQNHFKLACKLYKRCIQCDSEYNTREKHICGSKFCNVCKIKHSKSEGCYIKKIIIPKNLPVYRIISYDIECSTDNLIENGKNEGIFEHKVVFLSARITCSDCDGENKDCDICGLKGIRHHTWCTVDNFDPVFEFLTWVLSFKHFETICYAHFAGRYDAHFILRALTELGYIPEIIISDLKIYQIKLGNLFFRDFWLMSQNKLSELPKTFGLDCTPKLYFPHKYNSEKNYGKINPTLPPMEDYYPDSMKKDEFEKFQKWYKENNDTPFLLEEQLKIYCGQDTEILLKAVLAMRKIFIEITRDELSPNGFDVFKTSTTIAGAAIKIYRAKFLKEKHIAIVPEGGFEKKNNQSFIAIKYFQWFMFKNGVNARHAGNGGEVNIGGFNVDFICGKYKTIIEFQGCVFHGCKKCLKPFQICPNGKTAEENFAKTKARIFKLRKISKKYGLKVEEIWECDVRRMINPRDKENYNAEMKKYFDMIPDKGPIDPREAFAGGRTQAFCLYSKTEENTEINLADIISLYPSVNYFTSYPVKTPNIIIPKRHDVFWESPEDILYDGLLKVRVIPPKNLKIPLLPFHADSILFFTNCSKCCQRAKSDFVFVKNVKKCKHTDTERGLHGVFTSIELKLAMELGYKIDKFYRAYHFEEFDSNLFKGYVRKFLKLKVESSGWPSNVTSDEQRINFINEYKRIFDIVIDSKNMEYNSGMRFISKLLLNSLWGKFGMRNKLSKNKIINRPSEYFELLFDHKIILSKPILINDGVIRVVYREKDEFVGPHSVSNIIIALWTTSQARIVLYKFLQKVASNPHNKLLYSDTDSVIYKHKTGNNPIVFGEYLGEMSHENVGNKILEFVSGGSKQYSIKFQNESDGQVWYKTKIRGITFNNKNKIDHEDFKEMILNYADEKRKYFNYDKFGPSRESYILSRKMTKEYKPVQKKGIIDEHFDIIPYGFW